MLKYVENLDSGVTQALLQDANLLSAAGIGGLYWNLTEKQTQAREVLQQRFMDTMRPT